MEEIRKTAFDRLDYIFKLSVVIAIGITGLILASDIFIPLIFGAILAIALQPLAKMLERWIGRIPAILVVLVGTLIVVSMVTWLIGNQIVQLVDELPDLEQRFTLLIHNVSLDITNKFAISAEEQLQMTKDFVKSLTSFMTGLLKSTTSIVSIMVQIPIYILLILIYQDRFRDFFLRMFPHASGTLKKEADRVIRGYITGQLLVILLITTLDTLGLLIIGIDYAFFFGLLSGLLTVIPYIGNFIGGSLPVIMALVTKDSAWYAVAVIALYAVVHFIEGNFIAPRIMGHRVSVNALAAIVGLLVGGKILGIAGMIMAVPVIGMMRIVLSFSEKLSPFVILLEDKPMPREKTGAEEEPKPPS